MKFETKPPQNRAITIADEQRTEIYHGTVVNLGVEFDSGGEVIRFFATFPLDVTSHAGPLLSQYWGVLQ